MGKGIFDIDIYRLENGNHTFEFDFDSAFFRLFEDSVLESGAGTIIVELNKSPNLLSLAFSIKGEIELICDRSLDPFMYPVNETKEVRVKYGDHWEELSDDLLLVPANTQKIDVGQFVYEFLSLAMPMKKLHPRYHDEEDEEIIYSSSEEEEGLSDNTTDPRWNELKKLKKKR
ncbi:MAG: DUF177 domain-containing protein [Bacteroidota bacterium]